MANQIKVDIASPPDRERVVAQIMIGNEQWAEINQEHVNLQLEIYPRQDGKPWVIEFDQAMRSLQEARRRLLGGA